MNQLTTSDTLLIVPSLSDVISVSILVTRVFKPPSALVARYASAAIGTKSVENTKTIYKRIEDLEAKKHKTSDVTAATGKYVSGVKVDANGALTIKETSLTAGGVAAAAINAGDATVAVEGTNVSA